MADTDSENVAGGSGGGAGGDEARLLGELRERIDSVDARLIELLNERAAVVVEVGALKRTSGTPIYAPHREAAVLKRVLAANKGPLHGRAIEGVYRELMSGSFALEHPLRIGFLGPAGSFSHQASAAHFGTSVSFEDLREIEGVFTEVRRGHVDYGLVPIENTTGGGIVETLDAFKEYAGLVAIYAEMLVSVRHALLANCEPREVTRIHSKPEIFAQCRRWLSTQYPNAELVSAPSSSRAVQMVSERAGDEEARGWAAIGSTLAGQLYSVKVLFEDIQDKADNVTRFFVLAKEEAEPSGDDKTSVMFTTTDKPGALVQVLSVFERAGINLTHIDKRPSGRVNWQYTFFVDAQGHRDDANMKYALREAGAHCQDLVVLGSYPRATRIL